MSDNPETMSMESHAIAWWTMRGRDIPFLDTEEWDRMYCEWIDFAFETFPEENQ